MKGPLSFSCHCYQSLSFNSGLIRTSKLLYSFKEIASCFLTATLLQFLKVILVGSILEELLMTLCNPLPLSLDETCEDGV